MPGAEPKYPVEPLPRLFLPLDYLHNPLFFNLDRDEAPTSRPVAVEANARRRSRSSGRRTKRSPQRNHLHRELDFSAQEESTLVDVPLHVVAESPRQRVRSTGREKKPAAPSLAASTKAVRLREEYILRRELDRLRDEEHRRLHEVTEPERLPPPPKEDVDEHMLRPTRAVELRQQYVARKQHLAEEEVNNIHFLKGKDTSWASAPLLDPTGKITTLLPVGHETSDNSVSSGRLTKAAQLLREHTLKRLEEREEAEARRKAEDEALSFKPTLTRPRQQSTANGWVSSSSGTTPLVAAESMSGSDTALPRRTKTESLRTQCIAERLAQLEKERATEQAARDAILYGPGSSHHRPTRVAAPSLRAGVAEQRAPPSARVTTPKVVVRQRGQPRGENRELVVTSVNPPAKPTPPKPGERMRLDGTQPFHVDPTINKVPLKHERTPSASSSSSSSIKFYVEVTPPTLSKENAVNGHCELDETTSGAEVPVAEVQTTPRLTPTPSAKGVCVENREEATVVDLTPVAVEHTRERRERCSPPHSVPSFSSLSTVAKLSAATLDPSQAQAEMLRWLREKRAAAAPLSQGAAKPRVPVLFTSPQSATTSREPHRQLPPETETVRAKAPLPAVANPCSSPTPTDCRGDAASPALSSLRRRSDEPPSSLNSMPESARQPQERGHPPGHKDILRFPQFSHGENDSLSVANSAPATGGSPSGYDGKRALMSGPPADPLVASGRKPHASVMQNGSSLLSRSPVESMVVPTLQESNKRSFADTSVTLHARPVITQLQPSHLVPAPGLSAALKDRDLLDSMLHSVVCAPQSPSQPAASPSSTSHPCGGLGTPNPSPKATTTAPIIVDCSEPVRTAPRGAFAVTAVEASSVAATPPREVNVRDALCGMRKAPNQYTLPPSELKNQKETQTLVEVSTMTTSTPPRHPIRPTPSPARTTPLTDVPSVASSVRSQAQAPQAVNRRQPPPLRRGGAEHAVSVRPRGSPTKRTVALLNRTPGKQLAGPAVSSDKDAYLKVESATPEKECNGKGETVGTQAGPQSFCEDVAEEPSAPSALTHLLTFLDPHEEEKEPRIPESSFVPQDGDALGGSRRSILTRDEDRPGSHAPTPVRQFESPQESAVQSSPPPRPAPRARSGSITNAADDLGHGSPGGLTRFVLPELSVHRKESESLHRAESTRTSIKAQLAQDVNSPSPAMARLAAAPAAALPSSSPNSSGSSSFISSPLRDRIAIALPEIQTEQERIRTSSDEPIHAALFSALHHSAFSETSSSFRDSSAERDWMREAVKKQNSLSCSHDRAGEEKMELPASSESRTASQPHKGDPVDNKSPSPSRSSPSEKQASGDKETSEQPLAAERSPCGEAPSRISSAEELENNPLAAANSNGVRDLADEPFDLDERPAAPVPLTRISDGSGSGRAATGVTAWSAGSPADFSTFAPSPILSERGATDDLANAFGRRGVPSPVSAPLKPRYVHTDL